MKTAQRYHSVRTLPQTISSVNRLTAPCCIVRPADKATDTSLKKVYAYLFLVIFFVQLFSLNIIFVLVGAGCLKYNDANYLKLFMSGTSAGVFSIVLVITQYLFSKDSLSPSLTASRFIPKSKRDQMVTGRGGFQVLKGESKEDFGCSR